MEACIAWLRPSHRPICTSTNRATPSAILRIALPSANSGHWWSCLCETPGCSVWPGFDQSANTPADRRSNVNGRVGLRAPLHPHLQILQLIIISLCSIGSGVRHEVPMAIIRGCKSSVPTQVNSHLDILTTFACNHLTFFEEIACVADTARCKPSSTVASWK
jgi:hypothetical protein